MTESSKPKKPRRVAISLEMDWGYKRHVEVYAGCQRFADEAGWDAYINPAADRDLKAAFENGTEPPFDGVLCRANRQLLDALTADFISSGYDLRHLILAARFHVSGGAKTLSN